MRRIHYAPVTAANYIDAVLTDAADALSFAESIDSGDSFDFFGSTPAPVTQARRAPVRVTAALAATVAATAAAVVVLAPAAHADPVQDQPGGVHVTRISPAPAGPAITVTLSNGKRDQLRPCVYEDGRRCYWQADQMGNGVGSSFVTTRGVRFYVNLTGFVGGAR